MKIFKASEKPVEFYLPVVTERLVMGVQSGYDIFSAIERVCAFSNEFSDGDNEIFSMLRKVLVDVDSGLMLADSLNDRGRFHKNAAVRHVFLHLSLAHSQGGDIIKPLEELSSDAQLFYQESVEDRIAKLPALATIPLLLIFSGLILSMITSPLIEFESIIDTSTYESERSR